MKHRSNALDALDHARRDGRKKQFGRIESVWPAVDIGIKLHLCCVFAAGQASVRVHAFRHDVIFEHLRYPNSGLPAAPCGGFA